MDRNRTTSFSSRAGIAALLLALATSASAQTAASTQQAAPAAPASVQPAAAAKKPFTEAELAALMAPIALYPDNVIAQILMAATYPIEVIEAYRWQQKNKELKGDALYAEVQKQEWEDSVKSLVAAPEVLKMMDENLGWMQKIGDAFLAQQKEVFDMVQTLRGKAMQAGTLKSDEHLKVSTKAAAPPAEAPAAATATATATVTTEEKPPQVIVIESADPEVIYVPTYAPSSMYGSWGYSYPPYYWPPPMGYPGSGFWFGMGVGIIAGGAWGGCCWGGGDVDIDWNGGDINIGGGDRVNVGDGSRGDRVDSRRGEAGSRTGDRAGATGQSRGGQGGQKWSHSPEHRKGASYRDSATASKFDRASAGAGSREAFRGRTGDTGSRPSAGTRDAGSGSRPSAGTGSRGSTGTGSRDSYGSGSRGSSGSSSRGSYGSGSRGSYGSSGSRGSSGAFGGMSSGSRAGSYGSRGGMSRGGGRGGGGRRR